MKFLYTLLFLTMTAISSNIPIAVPIDDLQNDIRNIQKNIKKIIENVDKTNTALNGFNAYNIISLQTGVHDLNNQLNKVINYNQNMDKMSSLIAEFNKLLKPISDLAHDKIKSSEIYAKIKEKEFVLKLSEIRAQKENIHVWNAYQLNIKKSYSDNTLEYTICILIPVIIALSTIIITKSHL